MELKPICRYVQRCIIEQIAKHFTKNNENEYRKHTD